jgi:hypothetical protein
MDADEVARLYQQGLTEEQVAQRLGASRTLVGRYLRERGIRIRGQRKHESDVERQRAKKENRERFYQNPRELRSALFGQECRICGVSKDERNLAIHRKDGTPHEEESLRRLSFLKSVNPDEWASLCVACHRGVHWAMGTLGMDWSTVESKAHSGRPVNAQSAGPMSRPLNSVLPSSGKDSRVEGNVEEMRKTLFGDKCHFCGTVPEGMRLVVHRKDGSKHSRRLLSLKKYLRELNPDEWVALCQKHHRYVHWAMDRLHLRWQDMDSAFHGSQT